jgi:hypothetical protein
MKNIQQFLDIDPEFRPDVEHRHNQDLLPKAPLLHRICRMAGLSDLANRAMPKSVRPLLRRTLFRTGPAPRISDADRAILVEHFREDIVQLSELVERDLSHWMRVS